MDAILDRAPCGFFSFDDLGIIRETNATLRELLGYEAAELHGQRIDRLFAIGGAIYFQTHFFPVLKLQGKIEEIYLKLRTRTGEEVPVLVNAVRSESPGDQQENRCVVIRMAHRERYEDEILRAKRAAEAASDAKAKFLSLMSHELRTPLQAILGFVDLLTNGTSGPLTATQREDLESIKTATNGLARLINDILNFAKIESGSMSFELGDVRAAEAVHRAEVLLRVQMKDAGLVYQRASIPPDLAVRADDYRLQQILLNLLSNAIKFTEPGGHISVSCTARDDLVALNISDTGCGISPENRERVFQPFVQLDRDRIPLHRRGVGLGLAISRDLARAMGGDLTVVSESGKGSTFTITLPATGSSE